jgi:hypothetical protein
MNLSDPAQHGIAAKGEGYLTLVAPIPGGGQRFMMRNDAGKVLNLDCFVELNEDKQVELQALLIRFFEQVAQQGPGQDGTRRGL